MRLRGRLLDLTYKEFELLKYLAQHPGRVFTRSQLLQEVWGYDYFGGTRTVDVHVRRLRAKLGTDYEVLIGTVRNVGYRFVPGGGRLLLRARGLTWRAPSASLPGRRADRGTAAWRESLWPRARAGRRRRRRVRGRPAAPSDRRAPRVVHLLRRPATAPWSGTPRWQQRARRMPSPSWSSTPTTAVRARAGAARRGARRGTPAQRWAHGDAAAAGGPGRAAGLE